MFVKQELGKYETSKVCRILNVSRSSFYRKPTRTENEEKAIEAAIIQCFKQHKRRYGRIRIRKTLERKGIQVSEYKISRVLKENGLTAISGRTGKKKAKKPSEQQYVEENLIKNKFEVTEKNKLWCSDITELRCKGSKLYVCGIIDVGTRRNVGWAIDRFQTQKLVQDAFVMAVGRNPDRPKDAIFHSDRGCQYTAKRTKELIEAHGFTKSMSRPGTPSDNQPIESFWRTLEAELPSIRDKEFSEAKRTIVEYIELYYNSERLHSGIDYNIPNEYAAR